MTVEGHSVRNPLAEEGSDGSTRGRGSMRVTIEAIQNEVLIGAPGESSL